MRCGRHGRLREDLGRGAVAVAGADLQIVLDAFGESREFVAQRAGARDPTTPTAPRPPDSSTAGQSLAPGHEWRHERQAVGEHVAEGLVHEGRRTEDVGEVDALLQRVQGGEAGAWT